VKVTPPVPVKVPIPVIVRQELPVRHPAVVGVPVMSPALKLFTVKPKVSPASVVEKSWIEGGVLFPCT
jgi:hypothetical protein